MVMTQLAFILVYHVGHTLGTKVYITWEHSIDQTAVRWTATQQHIFWGQGTVLYYTHVLALGRYYNLAYQLLWTLHCQYIYIGSW